MDFLRRETYALSPSPLKSSTTDYEFEARYKAMEGMAVGIFNSGLGGLTVLDAVARRLPDVPFVYYGDNAHAPYGVRDADDIFNLTTVGVQRLFDAGCDLVILACNTASAAALKRMQDTWVPKDKRVLGVFVPLIEALTERRWGDNSPPREVAVKHVALFATPATVAPAPSSASLPSAPSAWTSRRSPAAASSMRSRTATDARRNARPLPCRGAEAQDAATRDAAVLGCTHYPLMEESSRRARPPGEGLQPGQPRGRKPRRLPARRPEMVGQGTESAFLTTGDPRKVSDGATRFLKRKIEFRSA